MKVSNYILLFLTLLTGAISKAQITYPLGREAALDILFNMPDSLTNTEIGWKLAEHAGPALWKSYSYMGGNNPAQVLSTNGAGKLDLSVTISGSMSYTGTITAQGGIPVASISGSISGQMGVTVTGTYLMSFSWETLADMDNKIYVEYKIGVGGELRTGHLVTPHILEELPWKSGSPPVISPAEQEASAANGGVLTYRTGYKYYSVYPSYWLFLHPVYILIYPTEYPQ